MSRRGYFAVGIYSGKTPANTGTLWRSAHSLGASFMFTVGCRYHYDRTDTTKAALHVPLFNFASVDELRRFAPKQCELVGVELTDVAEPIAAFEHPERAIYMLGAEDYGLSKDALDACSRVVVLPGRYCLNVAVAGSMVMFDRIRKAS